MYWQLDNLARIESLVSRVEAQETFVYRDRCDCADPARRAILAHRRAILMARKKRLQRAARVLRHERKAIAV